ncbi:putative dsRNA-binding protein, partial [Chloroflexota bacterium]
VARDFVQNMFDEEVTKVVSQSTAVDYKSQLQEFMQSSRQVTPAYRLIGATGPDHDKRFTVEVIAGDVVLGRGSGKSKKLAETEAARSALKRLSDDFTQ